MGTLEVEVIARFTPSRILSIAWVMDQSGSCREVLFQHLHQGLLLGLLQVLLQVLHQVRSLQKLAKSASCSIVGTSTKLQMLLAGAVLRPINRHVPQVARLSLFQKHWLGFAMPLT